MSWSAQLRARAGELELEVELQGHDGVLGLVGPNGSGKSTLARVLVGAHPLLDGQVEVGGRTVAHARRGLSLLPHQRGIAYLPQGGGLFPHLDVLGNVAFGLRGPGRDTRAADVLARHGLEGLASRRIDTLSGGERQQVALARALAPRPHLLVLDEPMAAMDVAARRAARQRLAATLAEAALPTLLITHDLRDLVALDATCVVLEKGRVVQRGRPEALADAPATPFVEELVGADLIAASRRGRPPPDGSAGARRHGPA